MPSKPDGDAPMELPRPQRGYLLHFSSAKQSQTRVRRIEKALPRIFEGKGLHDR